MTNLPSPDTATEQIRCAKCGFLNHTKADNCRSCGRHLWINCHLCGEVNARVNQACDACRGQLHIPRLSPPPAHKLCWPWCWYYDRDRKWLLPLLGLCFLAAVVLGSGLAISGVNFLDNFDKVERYLFADVFETYPALMPRRILWPLHAITLGLFFLPPVGLLALVSWLGRPKPEPGEARE